MYKKFILITLLLLTVQPVFSQKLLIEEYIIKKSGDTIRGYIQYKDWRFSPDVIRLKKDIDSDFIKLKATDIKEFKADGNHFISYAGPIL